MNRREALIYFGLLFPVEAISQVQPLALRLVRRTGWQALMGTNKCVIGDMFVTSTSFPLSDRGSKISNALELAYRNNDKNISSIPAGQYRGAVRVDGHLGWRIELIGTGNRTNVQIHIGNRPVDTIGCILLGLGDSTDSQCEIGGSAAAMDKLKSAYADLSGKRAVVLKIEG